MKQPPPKATRGSGPVQVVLAAVFLIPLAVGVLLVSNNSQSSVRADQVSRDLASMYSQGVDFSRPANQSIALQLLDSTMNGQGLIILTRMRAVGEHDCESIGTDCVNAGYPVITQRIVIGDPSLRASSLGTPHSVDHNTGEVLNWARDASARVMDPDISLKPGESAVAAETYLTAPASRGGVYARTVF